MIDRTFLGPPKLSLFTWAASNKSLIHPLWIACPRQYEEGVACSTLSGNSLTWTWNHHVKPYKICCVKNLFSISLNIMTIMICVGFPIKYYITPERRWCRCVAGSMRLVQLQDAVVIRWHLDLWLLLAVVIIWDNINSKNHHESSAQTVIISILWATNQNR